MSTGNIEGRRDIHLRRRALQWCALAALAFGAIGVLAAILGSEPTASAQSMQSSRQRPDVFAVAGRITADTYGLYLVDVQHGTVALYEYAPNERKLHLRAARSVVYDLQLENYNTSPDPAEVADMVRRMRRISETVAPPPQAGQKE